MDYMLAADIDEEIFSAESALELVDKLRDHPWTADQSLLGIYGGV